ncbi:sensor histidine kinase [Actinokineospora iranica]|uniref:histidine kinase n=1 Tax=Actinokineospora iranica TaxID=1271860 RepID=A0A1G6XPT2_9PSEU|nr:HAMP domain-containing sensor histidine kinase [Actinokineospora iranica]SDD80150.1 Signal transduction histidine kinase [Actinokineospora iranica]
MTGAAADRLRRLRLVLTALFTTMNALGLVVVSWLVIGNDQEQRDQRLDARLQGVTATVSRLLRADADGTVSTAGIDRDELNDMCPQFAVLPAGGGSFPAKFSKVECVPVDRGLLADEARKAVGDQRLRYGRIWATDGRPVRIRVEPIRGQSGRYVGAVIALADATDEQRAHDTAVWRIVGGCLLLVGLLGAAGHILAGRAIRPAASALEQQEQLLAETAHDLRTPVAALRALAETALRNPGERADLLPRTVELAARMGGVIDGLLVRARLAAGVDRLAVQPVWLDQLVADVVESTPAQDAQVTLTAAASAVLADPTLVQRAIGNLLDNALRYGRKPGERAIVHITVANGRVTVADHGPGIDADAAEEMFNRFRTGSGSSGLGLSIVRWVAQAHGGRLNLYNADEGGAIFELELPVAPDRR